MNVEEQDEFLRSYKLGCLSFCMKYFTLDNFDLALLQYVNEYKELDKLSKNRRDQASSYLMGILSALEEVKFAVKDKYLTPSFYLPET